MRADIGFELDKLGALGLTYTETNGVATIGGTFDQSTLWQLMGKALQAQHSVTLDAGVLQVSPK